MAKKSPERAWLAEVASVALVQACQDARRADRMRGSAQVAALYRMRRRGRMSDMFGLTWQR